MSKTMLLISGLLLGTQALAADLGQKAADITSRLTADGFENVRVVCTDDQHTEVALEDNHYHGIYHGLAQALRLIAAGDGTSEAIRLTVLQDRMPRLTLEATHTADSWDIRDVRHSGRLSEQLRRVQAAESSACKADLVLYPGYGLTNDGYEQIWSAHVALNPALEMTFWPGSHLLVQAHIPIWDNYDHPSAYGYNDGFGLTRAVFSQRVYADSHWDVTASAGLFSAHRTGLDLKAYYHVTNALDLGLKVGETGPWSLQDGSFELGQWNRLTLQAYASYYETRSKLQVEVHAGQFLYEDRGVRVDVYRHYADYAVGLYGSATSYGSSLGFAFSAPIGPRKMGRHRTVRVRLPETLSFSFEENTNVKSGHSSTQIGQQYSVLPEDQSHSSGYWQPEFVRTYVLRDLRGEQK